jgi:hypothetical protein
MMFAAARRWPCLDATVREQVFNHHALQIMDQYLVAIAAYALAAFLVRLFMAVEFARSPASAGLYETASIRLKVFFWLVAVPSFSAFPVLCFMSGYRVLAALFAVVAPLAVFWFKATSNTHAQQASLAQA